MNTALFLISGLTLLLLGIGGVLVFVGIRTAPDGYEDATGFHAVEASHRQASPMAIVPASEAHHEVSLAA